MIILYVTLGILAILGITATAYTKIEARYQRNIKRKSVKSIIERKRDVIK